MKDLSPNSFNEQAYNVKAYGAKGDNANADHVGFQAAMDAAWRAGGGDVVVPKGIYRIMQHPMRMRENVTLRLLAGAELHSYDDHSSMFWNGDGSQNRAGWTGHGNLAIIGGTFDMRRSTSTHGLTTQVSGGTTAPAQGTSESWTVTNNATSPGCGFPQVPFYVYDPAAPSETMKVTAVTNPTSNPMTFTVTRGVGPNGATSTPVTHAAGFVIRNADMQLASDLFTRADTAAPHTLGVMDTGQTWINETSRGTGDQGTGSLGISTNTVYAPVAATNINTVFAWPDGSVSCTIPTVGTTGYAGLVFRVDDSQNYWQYVRDNAAGTARLSYFVQGTETVVSATATPTVTAGSTLKVVFAGSSVKAYVGTTLTHDTTDANLTAARKTGLIITDTTSRLDAFSSSAIIWSDTFTRANSTTSLGTSSSNIAWTAQQGTLGINSNAAYAPSALAAGNIATVPATQETNVECIMTTVGNGGIVFRYLDNNNYLYYVRDTGGNARLGKVVAGVDTEITTNKVTTAVAANALLRVTVLGGHIRCYVGATKTHDTGSTTTWESFNYQEKNVGIIAYDTAVRLDAFQAVTAWGGSTSGACFNFGHGENILLRDTTVRDVTALSHGIEIAGCKNVLSDNVTYTGMSPVYGRWSEAFQMDITKGNSYFAAFGPHDNTTNRDVIVRGCSFIPSNMPGTTSWTRGVGSHSSTVGVWHDHLRVTDNFFECTEKAIRSYNWNNCQFRGNVIRSGSGIEARVIDTADAGDTINTAGTQTSGSQEIFNIQVEGNIIYADQSTSTAYAIQITGVATGRAVGIVVRGNDIRWTFGGGIQVNYGNSVLIQNNLVNSLAETTVGQDTGNHGIKVDQCKDTLISGNGVYRIGQHAIYVTGASTDTRVLDNLIRGASRSGNGTSAGIKMDGSPDDVTLSGNCVRKWGSGNEYQWAMYCSTGTNVRRLQNDLEAGTSGDISIVSTGDAGNVMIARAAADITGLTSTTYASVTGLSAPINTVGTYRFQAYIPFSITGTTPRIMFGVTGPTATAVVYTNDVSATTGSHVTYISGSYNQAAIASTGFTTSTVMGSTLQGWVEVSATGTLQLTYIVAGTSANATVKAGATFVVERVTGS